MKQIAFMVLMLVVVTTYGQKKQLVEYRENIVARAAAELDSVAAGPDGIIFKQISESGVRGQYIFDITIREKGEIATVFVVNDGVNSIAMQNRLKDIVKRYRFSFKVPKGKSYKFQYTFNL